jgi:hypothetical protein
MNSISKSIGLLIGVLGLWSTMPASAQAQQEKEWIACAAYLEAQSGATRSLCRTLGEKPGITDEFPGHVVTTNKCPSCQ